MSWPYEQPSDTRRDAHQMVSKPIYHNHILYRLCSIYVSARTLQDEELESGHLPRRLFPTALFPQFRDS
jgi:hypothetical protein